MSHQWQLDLAIVSNKARREALNCHSYVLISYASTKMLVKGACLQQLSHTKTAKENTSSLHQSISCCDGERRRTQSPWGGFAAAKAGRTINHGCRLGEAQSAEVSGLRGTCFAAKYPAGEGGGGQRPAGQVVACPHRVIPSPSGSGSRDRTCGPAAVVPAAAPAGRACDPNPNPLRRGGGEPFIVGPGTAGARLWLGRRVCAHS